MMPHCPITLTIIEKSQAVIVALDQKSTPNKKDLGALTESLINQKHFINALKVKRKNF